MMSRTRKPTKQKVSHLNMALLQTPLDEIDGGYIKVVLHIALQANIDTIFLVAGAVGGLLHFLGRLSHRGGEIAGGVSGSK